MLTNTVDFKGSWQSPFPKSDYQMNWVQSGKTKSVSGMSQTNVFNFVENSQVQVLELPYAGIPLSMLVILPRPDQDFGQFRTKLSLGALNKIRGQLKPTRVRVELPKFSFAFQLSARQQLETAMPLAFSEKADFSGISESGDIHLHDVVHKAFIAVDEDGTEASAASAVVAGVKQLAEAEFLAQRPFIFLLVDDESGAIWFGGQLVNP
ncbi:Protease inhibitor I4, serpin [Rhodopirellula sallentina SM41]|uniref:Protease inhibitor I4, serpin n=1 Tax=Rhodopirellula sallentina SM41 TaxID=1263870 RepID=M5UDB7_9BACT|nr:Protease inhibitor I4, serpin [Rhodopirellula sallentina SM41]